MDPAADTPVDDWTLRPNSIQIIPGRMVEVRIDEDGRALYAIEMDHEAPESLGLPLEVHDETADDGEPQPVTGDGAETTQWAP